MELNGRSKRQFALVFQVIISNRTQIISECKRLTTYKTSFISLRMYNWSHTLILIGLLHTLTLHSALQYITLLFHFYQFRFKSLSLLFLLSFYNSFAMECVFEVKQSFNRFRPFINQRKCFGYFEGDTALSNLLTKKLARLANSDRLDSFYVFNARHRTVRCHH